VRVGVQVSGSVGESGSAGESGSVGERVGLKCQ
jgi:hypothetical protein